MPHTAITSVESSTLSVQPHITIPQGTLSTSDSSRTAVGLFQCLIVSNDPRRREMLMRSAREGGWNTIVAPDVVSARSLMRRYFVQLAIVDLEHTTSTEPEGFREVLEELSALSGLLLIVCGNEDEPLEEIWARQLGVWLYLPGVTAGEDVTMLCGEALQIAGQIHGVRHDPAHPAGNNRHITPDG